MPSKTRIACNMLLIYTIPLLKAKSNNSREQWRYSWKLPEKSWLYSLKLVFKRNKAFGLFAHIPLLYLSLSLRHLWFIFKMVCVEFVYFCILLHLFGCVCVFFCLWKIYRQLFVILQVVKKKCFIHPTWNAIEDFEVGILFVQNSRSLDYISISLVL